MLDYLKLPIKEQMLIYNSISYKFEFFNSKKGCKCNDLDNKDLTIHVRS